MTEVKEPCICSHAREHHQTVADSGGIVRCRRCDPYALHTPKDFRDPPAPDTYEAAMDFAANHPYEAGTQ